MNKEKFYETPCIMEIKMISEQTILTASGGNYPAFSEEEDWGY